MAIVKRGRLKGKEVTLSQYCNNWVTVKEFPEVLSLTSLEFTQEEMFKILTSENLGFMLLKYDVALDKRSFKKRK